MRRRLFVVLGGIECSVALALVLLGFYLPSQHEVHQGFERLQRVNSAATQQVVVLRDQVQDLRRPELTRMLDQLQVHSQTVPKTLRNQRVDFETVLALRDALDDVAAGLDELSLTFDPAAVERLGKSLAEGAAFVDDEIIPNATRAADELDATAKGLQQDARLLEGLLKTPMLDLQAAREVHDGLARFRQGLDKTHQLLDPQRLKGMRDGAAGMHSALTTAAEQINKASRLSYPVVTFERFQPRVRQTPFWPEGEQISSGLEQAATGVDAMRNQLDALAGDLPVLQLSLAESSRLIDRTQKTLGVALKQAEQLEPLLKHVPENVARVADSLPRLLSNLSRTLREAQRLKAIAEGLRQTEQGVGAAIKRWSRVRTNLESTAKVLKTFRDQMDMALAHREEYETLLQQSLEVSESFASALPVFADQFDRRLNDEQRVLTELESSLNEVHSTLPVFQSTAVLVLTIGRYLAWLVAAIAGLHGAHLALGSGQERHAAQ